MYTQSGTECVVEKPNPVIYETEQEEFMEPGQDDAKPAACSFTAMYTVHST